MTQPPAAPTLPAPAAPPTRDESVRGRSITDFLTDGSLAALCTELARLTGVHIELRDNAGRRIVRRVADNGQPGWEFLPLNAVKGSPSTAASIPLVLAESDGRPIGEIAVADGQPHLSGDARERLESVLRLLAGTAGELCQHEVELRHRVKEVAALSRMSSLLVRAAGPDRVLEVALESALEVLGLDAGAVYLLKEDADGVTSDNEADLVVKANRNLSRKWIDFPRPLSKDRLFDKLAMSGQIVVSEDLSNDDRISLAEEARAEGLGAAIHAGLVFKSRALGVMRLYARTPRTFDEADRRLLASLVQQASVALEQSRLLRFEQEEQRVQRQLQLASDVQRRMLPRSVPSIRSLDMAARYIPSFELGGDFYDFVDLSGHLGVAVGDVVGKGIAAALLMASVRASLRAHVQEVYDLDEVVSRVNVALCNDTRDNEFASLWYGVIDPVKLRLTYCSGGHEPPLVVRVPQHRAPTSADMDELSVGGMVVGVDPSQRYQRAVFDLRPRDVLVAYTDGMTDATNFTGEKFGKKRLRASVLKALSEKPNGTAAELVERILWDMRQFTGLAQRTDDKTLVVVRVLGDRS
ncbi:MAG: SpoIIE family protein phosphatase [Planctomycetes bacterium]|nr:SpoIIE family protein phosphatase [Planctomycetota bacterium]